MGRLRDAAYANDENIRSLVVEMAPTYRPDGDNLPEASEKALVHA